MARLVIAIRRRHVVAPRIGRHRLDNSNNLQGAGSTIVEISPSGHSHVLAWVHLRPRQQGNSQEGLQGPWH